MPAMLVGGLSRRNLDYLTAPLPRRLHQAAQHLGDAPGLGDAAARRERRVGVEDFADRTDPGLGKLGLESGKKTARGVEVFRVRLEPGIDEGADQPGPHGALVISRVASAKIAK